MKTDTVVILTGLTLLASIFAALILLVDEGPIEPHECDKFFPHIRNRECRSLRDKGVPMNTILVMYREHAR